MLCVRREPTDAHARIMTKYNTIPNDDEALLATKKQKSFKGLVVGAASLLVPACKKLSL